MIFVAGVVNSSSKNQPPNSYPVLSGELSVIVGVSIVYVATLLSLFTPPFSLYVIL